MRCTGVTGNRVTFELPESDALNPNGAVNGSVIAGILDQVLAVATLREMRHGHVPNTANLSVQFMRPALPPLTLETQVRKAGATLMFGTAEVHDRDGRLCVVADGTFAVRAFPADLRAAT